MRIRSFLSLVSLTLVTNTSALSLPRFITGGKQPPGLGTRGAPAQRNVLKRAVTGISDALPDPWTYRGCFTEAGSSRTLGGDRYSGDDMTQEKCIAYCNSKGYGMAGVEYGRECYCGYILDFASSMAPETDCSKPCAGNSDQVCGNGGRLNVFTNGDSGPTVLAASGDYLSRGCYSDQASARTLTTRMNLPGDLTVSECTTACAAQGFLYAGVEYGSECFCGTSIQNGGAPISASSCNMACAGDKTQYCGGPAAINIYMSSKPLTGSPSAIPYGWAQTCYTDSTSQRALSYKVPNLSKFSAAQCVSQCDSLNYKYAGVEYGSECYCGNTIDGGNKPAPNGCDMACDGNRYDTCGGAGHINIYQVNCPGVRGCGDTKAIIGTTTDIGTVKDCVDLCQADPLCLSFQFAPAESSCKTYKSSVAASLVAGTEATCSKSLFYDRACSMDTNPNPSPSPSPSPSLSPSPSPDLSPSPSLSLSPSPSPSLDPVICGGPPSCGPGVDDTIDDLRIRIATIRPVPNTLERCSAICQQRDECLSFQFDTDPLPNRCQIYRLPAATLQRPGTREDCPGTFGVFYEKGCVITSSPSPSPSPSPGPLICNSTPICGNEGFQVLFSRVLVQTVEECSDRCKTIRECLSF
ncbi:WSC-domain-containing protein [Colletotrichum caudatum]|nr:WSC-domain-containing protein [Colletotrichum caudatum]